LIRFLAVQLRRILLRTMRSAITERGFRSEH
jgi:hypothetical protein